jgi:hypothetical protein
MFDKLFGGGKKQAAARPDISTGRYSDNNKTVEKVNRWTDADALFKEKKFPESIDAFFDYLRDDAVGNVILERQGAEFNFRIYQGSKIVRGSGNETHLQAEVSLAKMPQPSVPVMRRLLEQNFSLYYSRYSLDGDRLCMRFDSDIPTANPNKLYYALKELATRADKQDDLLVQDFSSLQALDTEHVMEMPEAEKETRYVFMQKWIAETLQYAETLDADKFSGGISYLLLALSFRIDYLVCPEGVLQSELEKIPIIYFAKDEKPAVDKNNAMISAFRALQDRPREEIFRHLFRNKSTFAIVAPQNQKSITDSVNGANNNMVWYRDNGYTQLAQQICEYGISFCQYSYSLPKPLSELFKVFMQVNYPDYFAALGFLEPFYSEEKKRFDTDAIQKAVRNIESSWKCKYPRLEFNTQNLKFDNLLNFNFSYTAELANLNFDPK